MWCDEAFLQLNATKTKVIDFRRRSSHPLSQTFIKGVGIEFVELSKYLGTVTDKNLKFDANSDAICKKGHREATFELP